jgi:predicted double-glycine peptidase
MIRHNLALLRCCAVLAALSAAAPPALGATREASSKRQAALSGAPVRDEEHTFRRHVMSWRELQRENVVMQQRDYSCGAAALATLIRYHWDGETTEIQLLVEVVRMLTPEEMKERIKNGLSLTDLRRLAVRTGYLSSIGRLEFEKLREVKVPLIVGITVNDFDHFVVYRGTDGQYVYLADPARGNVRTPIPEFLEQWQKNAVLVVVKRGAKAEKKSPLLVRPEEIFLGELNRLHVRKRLESFTPVLP